MSVDASSKKKSRARAVVGLIASLVTIAALAYITVTLISKGELSSLSVPFLSSSEPEAEEFNFDTGRGRVFADLDGYAASAGSLGIQVFSSGGTETLRDQFRMSSPAIASAGKRAIAYDIGGTALRVFGQTELIVSLDAAGTIVSASLNEKGYFAVCTQEGSGLKGVVTVYNAKGKEIYRFESASGFVVSAELSPDSKSLAVLTLPQDGSKLTFFNLSSPDPVASFELSGDIILDIKYLSNGSVLAVSTNVLMLVDKSGSSEELYSFSGRRLGGYCFDGKFIALSILDYSMGHSGELITLTDSGEIIADISVTRENISMSAKDGYLAVLWDTGLMFYDSELTEYMPLDAVPTPGFTRVKMLGGKTALVAGDYSALVFSIGGSADSNSN